MKKYMYLLALLSLTYCSKESKANSEIITKDSLTLSKSAEADVSTSQDIISDEELFKNQNNELLQSLKEKNFQKFAAFIHPEKGVQFSMYAHINPKQDKRFSKDEFIKYASSNIKFTWGEKDGTGEKLVLPVRSYLDQWVWKKDFTKGQYYLNSFKGSGNSLNNLKDIYPTHNFTENYLPGSEEYGGMDWNCLRFVFEEFNGKNYVVAVINDQWTI